MKTRKRRKTQTKKATASPAKPGADVYYTRKGGWTKVGIAEQKRRASLNPHPFANIEAL